MTKNVKTKWLPYNYEYYVYLPVKIHFIMLIKKKEIIANCFYSDF